MAPEALDRVKIEIRSILLSSKHGVAAESIQSDYEMLMCQRLPLKELGFRDVQSLMRAIPDVAKEVRSHRGDITYFAVSDKSTAHIHKLVSHQVSKKKKSTGKYKKENSTGKYKKENSTGKYKKENSTGKYEKENSTGKYGALGRGGLVAKENQPPDSSSLVREAKQLVVRTRDPRIPKRHQSEKLKSYDSGDNMIEQCEEHGDLSATHEVRHFKNSQSLPGRHVVEPSSSQSNTDTIRSQQTSPVSNLRICVSQSGKRKISVLTQLLRNNQHYSQSDLHDFISRRESHIDSVTDASFNRTSRYMKAASDHADSVINKVVIEKACSRIEQRFSHSIKGEHKTTPRQESIFEPSGGYIAKCANKI